MKTGVSPNKPVANTTQPDLPPMEGFTAEQQHDLQSILDDEKDLADTKKILSDKINKLMDSGEKLEDLETAAIDLEKEAEVFKTNTVELKVAEQVFQSREYGLALALVGLGLGVLYGFLAGYSWPIMLLYGVASSALCYAATRIFTGINQTIDNIVHKLSKSWPFSVDRKVSEEPLKHTLQNVPNSQRQYLPGFAQSLKLSVEEKLSVQENLPLNEASKKYAP